MSTRIWPHLLLVLSLIDTGGAYGYCVSTTSLGVEKKWFVRSVPFSVNPSYGPADAGRSIWLAMTTWNNVDCSDFEFTGATTTTTRCAVRDYENVCSFCYLGGDGTIGQTTTWCVPSTGQILEADIDLNTYYYWSTTGASGKMDVQNIATHELGHAIGLCDLYRSSDSEKTMYGYSVAGETKKRSLDADDIAGLCYLYPAPPPPPPAPTITTPCPLASGTVGVPYYLQLSATGGTTPYIWSLGSGLLPPGLSLSSGGAVTGTPLYGGTWSFALRVTGGDNRASDKSCSLTIAGPELLWVFETNNSTITVNGYLGSDGMVIVPDTLNGIPVTAIGNGCFRNQGGLTNVVMANTVTVIGADAFVDCSNLLSVTFSTNLIIISSNAFFGCTRLSDLILPASATSIGRAAFFGCASLHSIAIPAGVTNIEPQAFSATPDLAAINVSPLNTFYSSVDGVLLDKTQTMLFAWPGGRTGAYRVPDTVISISEFAFHACSNLTSVSIPNQVRSIGDSAFRLCGGLTNVAVGNSLTNIGDYAFAECPGLIAVTFQGNSPNVGLEIFDSDDSSVIYYSPCTTGWSAVFAARPTAVIGPCWEPNNQFGWLYNMGSGWKGSLVYGWLWFSPDRVWVWSDSLQGWLGIMSETSPLWSPQYRWLTPSNASNGTAYTTTLGRLHIGTYSGTPIPSGWVVSDCFEFVWPAGDGNWFYSSKHGWVGVTPEGGIWCISCNGWLSRCQ